MSDTRFEYAHFNASGGGSIHRTLADALEAEQAYVNDPDYHGAVDVPPSPLSTGVWRRRVGEWEQLTKGVQP